MVILRALLFPLAIIYDGITRLRNHLYNIGHKKSFRFETMVISVGNLNIGGSGKTPMIEYLVKLLLPRYKIAILSRGYGRNTKGLRFASPSDNADTVGDEPFQCYRKFGDRVTVAVGEDRAFAIPHILQKGPTDVILLDDAFQHRSVDPQLSILLTDCQSPFYEDRILPVGNLRESRSGAARSHAVVVTKCPQGLSEETMMTMEHSIRRYAPGVPVFFTRLQYGTPVGFGQDKSLSPHIVLVSGIGNALPLEHFVQSDYKLIRHFEFRDHHRFRAKDIVSIHEFCRNQPQPVSILTTEKDMVKLIDPRLSGLIESMPWYYLPVHVTFADNGSNFDEMVLRSIEQAIHIEKT